MKSKRPNVDKYVNFLLQSELADGIKADYFLREPLARALVQVLTDKGIIDGNDVLMQFHKFVDEELISNIDRDDLYKNPDKIPDKLDFTD